ncbi:MAG: Hsp20/alpha crystallin family protein [Erysipelotrichaceae bacterium]|nr:Hsp20/alpha crystallin family protein [Erysipelotrichaceae bacterium]MDD3809442.1 Hsp20/alpha crystallin family protein [Erysipelotrichaceae bacterium]
MRFLPRLSLFDDIFDEIAPNGESFKVMKTDIKESDSEYTLALELPGYAKDNIDLSLKDGYLTVKAAREEDKETKDDEGVIIKKERYSGSCTRQFFVGDQVSEEDIDATFKNGELVIKVPKKEPAIETKDVKSIEIKE